MFLTLFLTNIFHVVSTETASTRFSFWALQKNPISRFILANTTTIIYLTQPLLPHINLNNVVQNTVQAFGRFLTSTGMGAGDGGGGGGVEVERL